MAIIDDSNKLEYRKLNDGREIWLDSQRNLVKVAKPDGFFIELKNKKITHIHSHNYDAFYDEQGKISHVVFDDGSELLYENGIIAQVIGKDGLEATYQNGVMNYCRLAEGEEAWMEDGQVVRVKHPDGRLIICDKKGDRK